MAACNVCTDQGHPEPCDCPCHDSETEAIECPGGCHEFYGKPSEGPR